MYICLVVYVYLKMSKLPLFLLVPSTRATAREDKAVQSFLESGPESWVESSFEVEGPLYYAVLALHVLPPSAWLTNRVIFLRRLLVLAHARHCAPSGCTRYNSLTRLFPRFSNCSNP